MEPSPLTLPGAQSSAKSNDYSSLSVYPQSSSFHTPNPTDYPAPSMYTPNPAIAIQANDAWKYSQLLHAQMMAMYQQQQYHQQQQMQQQNQSSSSPTKQATELPFCYKTCDPLSPEQTAEIVASKTCIHSMYKGRIEIRL